MWGFAGIQTRFFKRTALFMLFGAFFGSLQAKYTVSHIKVGDVGSIVATSTDHIKDATVERVVIYPQLNEQSKDHIERDGLFVRYNGAVANILMCHGFMCDKTDQGVLRQLFPRGRYNILIFNFRAHGENRKGQYCTLGRDEAYDVIAAAKFLQQHPDAKGLPTLFHGISMGAVAGIEAQKKDPTLFSAMLFDCPFDSSENIIKRSLESLKVTVFGHTFYIPGRSLLQRYAFHPYVQSLLKMVLKAISHVETKDIVTRIFPVDPVKSVAKVEVPSFFIYCKKDEKVSLEGMKSVFSNSGAANKKLWLTNGRGHFDSYFYNPEQYVDMVQEFFDDALQGKLATPRQQVVEDGDDQIVS